MDSGPPLESEIMRIDWDYIDPDDHLGLETNFEDEDCMAAFAGMQWLDAVGHFEGNYDCFSMISDELQLYYLPSLMLQDVRAHLTNARGDRNCEERVYQILRSLKTNAPHVLRLPKREHWDLIEKWLRWRLSFLMAADSRSGAEDYLEVSQLLDLVDEARAMKAD